MAEARRDLKWYDPEVDEVRELLEIARDFTDRKDAIREAISNSMDWGATLIEITVEEDRQRPDEELVITIVDNGVGLNEERLHAFFALGRTTEPPVDDSRAPVGRKIGYKGHGTKTFLNSRRIEVFSQTSECTVYAEMDEPLAKLMKGELPQYGCDVDTEQNGETRTEIKLFGYDTNRSKKDFAHHVLKDYVLWFTRFGSVEKEFDILGCQGTALVLQGLGRHDPEDIPFGHPFAAENHNIGTLRRTRPGDWTKAYVRRWLFHDLRMLEYPGQSIDIVFYIEGDEAKRNYNPMIRTQGKPVLYGMYKVEERYGLWACKDYIPVARVNEWLGLGKRLETKYHAFVNSQDFRLTANRGDIGNTPPDFLRAVEDTVRDEFERQIQGSDPYQEYEASAELAEQYQTAGQEKTDFRKRQKRARSKRVFTHKGVDLIEPGVEMGVVALFNQIYALETDLFPFRVVDYDTSRGYDALAVTPTPSDLSQQRMHFVEFKYMLGRDFNHSFDFLYYIVCWDCSLSDGDEVRDMVGKKRVLHITPRHDGSDHTIYMLVDPAGQHNIEVFVLKYYLEETRAIQFHPRSAEDLGG
jgi:hypothetical protein